MVFRRLSENELNHVRQRLAAATNHAWRHESRPLLPAVFILTVPSKKAKEVDYDLNHLGLKKDQIAQTPVGETQVRFTIREAHLRRLLSANFPAATESSFSSATDAADTWQETRTEGEGNPLHISTEVLEKVEGYLQRWSQRFEGNGNFHWHTKNDPVTIVVPMDKVGPEVILAMEKALQTLNVAFTREQHGESIWFQISCDEENVERLEALAAATERYLEYKQTTARTR